MEGPYEELLPRRQLVVVLGKGGVGKSALAAVLGRSLAARGRRTLLLEVDPRENLHQLLGLPPSGGEIAAAGDGLHLQNLKPSQVVDWVVERRLKIGMLVRRVKKSPIYHRFVEGAPGLEEMAVLGHALRVVRGELDGAPQIDTVVLDAPATGHSVYLLTAARLVAEAIGQGPFADLAREVADFVADPGLTATAVVTLAEEMPVQEAVELRASLAERFGREPELLIVNGLYPPLPDEAVGDVEGDDGELLSLWRDRRRVNERELGRLTERWRGPRIELPLLPVDQGPALVAELRRRFEEGLGALEEPPWS